MFVDLSQSKSIVVFKRGVVIVPALVHLPDKALMSSCDARSIDLPFIGVTFDCVHVFGSDMPDELMEFLVFSKEMLTTQ
nr:hypothetical protein [Saliphagus sp. LR7]